MYGWLGAFTTVSAGAFSASLPAYITSIVSAIWYRTERSCVITIMLLTKPRSRNSTSSSETARCVETSRAEVTSSAISSDGSRIDESTITTRCFIPPESSIGNRSSTSSDSPTSWSRRFSSGSTVSTGTSREARSSAAILPIRRVGFRAESAYCGMIETSLNLNAFIFESSQIGSSVPSRSTWPST